jgi:putative LysE/RhtB family amino acid efflux pump
MHAWATGFGLGFVVAAAIGPISLLCIRTVLRGSLRSGIAIGLGAAVIDAAYASAGSLGAARLLDIDALRVAVGAIGCAVIAYFGLRALYSAFRVRLGGENPEEVGSPARAFLTSLSATASNPSTILSWAAVFAAVAPHGTADTIELVIGVGCGTATWFTALSCGLALARKRVGDRVLAAVDVGSGLGLLAFAGVLGFKTAHDA